MFRILSFILFALATSAPAVAGAQAINGTIEGTVVDDQRALLPGVTVTVTNLDTGDVRSVVSNENGVYRALLLPLGTYKVTAELSGFKKFEHREILLPVDEQRTQCVIEIATPSDVDVVEGACDIDHPSGGNIHAGGAKQTAAGERNDHGRRESGE